jgi:GT2 family glycosyltransferase
MSYSLVDIDVAADLPSLSLGASETGLAVLVRRNGRPIAFWMEALPPETTLSPGDVAVRIAAHAAHHLLRERIRDDLVPAAEPLRTTSVTAAICTRDRPENVVRCLESLESAAAAASDHLPELEILVVDNAPSDARTRDLVASKPDVRYVCEPRAGLNVARNLALREATGELIAFVDDDVVVDRCWLSGLIQACAENPDAAAFTGLVLPYQLETDAQIMFELHGGFRRGFDRIRYQGPQLPGNPLYPAGAGIFGAGANMAFRRDALFGLGGFDEALDTGAPLPGGGDLDMFYRVVRARFPLVYEPRYLAFHQHRRDLAGLRRQYWSWGLGLMAFVSKSYRTDLEERAKLRKLVVWWFRYQGKQLLQSLFGSHPLTWDMVAAEIWGGLRGLFGEYARSQARMARMPASMASESTSSTPAMGRSEPHPHLLTDDSLL